MTDPRQADASLDEGLAAMTDHGQHDQGETPTCPFCAIIAGEAPAVRVGQWPGVIAIIPLNPVTQGHVLVLPTEHVEDFADDPDITAEVMRRAAQFATPPANLITSAGPEATQTVRHLHVHVVPRWASDGLKLPWTDQPQLGDEGRRAAQIKAARDVLERHTTIPGLQRQVLAAELVDAVNAAGVAAIPHLIVDVPAQLTDEEAEELKRRFLEAVGKPQRVMVLPGPTPDQLDQARAAGYREAITALRDDAGYRAWVKRQGFTAELGGTWRASIADYLEAVGPGQTDQKLTEEKERAPQPEDLPERLAWHYGPTDADPDPGKMWHYGCGQEVFFLDGGFICGCGAQEDGEASGA